MLVKRCLNATFLKKLRQCKSAMKTEETSTIQNLILRGGERVRIYVNSCTSKLDSIWFQRVKTLVNPCKQAGDGRHGNGHLCKYTSTFKALHFAGLYSNMKAPAT